MTTLNLQCGQSADDASETNTGTCYITESYGVAGSFAVFRHSGIRFTGVSGLSGATINTATLTFRAVFTDSGAFIADWYAEDGAAPSVFTTGVNDITGRLRTAATCEGDSTDFGNWTAGQDYAFTGNGVNTIADIIQELADSHDPSVILLVIIYGSGDGKRAWGAYDWQSANAAKLDIDFTAGGAREFTQDCDEAFSLSDIIATPAEYYRTLTQSLSLTDGITNIKEFYRTLTDTLSLSDAITNLRSRYKELVENIPLIDTLRYPNFLTLSEVIGLTDTLTRSLGGLLTKTLTETITLGDTMVKGSGKYFNEFLSLVRPSSNYCDNGGFETDTDGWDGPSQNTIERVLASSEGIPPRLGDYVLKCTFQNSTLFARYSITLAPAEYRASAYVYVPEDYDGSDIWILLLFGSAIHFGLVDSNGVKGQWVKVGTSSRIAVEENAFLGVRVLTFAPTVGGHIYIDGVEVLKTKILLSTSKSLVESLSLGDVLARSYLRLRILTESLSLTGTIVKVSGKVLTEAVTVADVLVKAPSRILIEALSLTDTLVKMGTKSLTDTLSMADTLLRAVAKALLELVGLRDVIQGPPVQELQLISGFRQHLTLASTFRQHLVLTSMIRGGGRAT